MAVMTAKEARRPGSAMVARNPRARKRPRLKNRPRLERRRALPAPFAGLDFDDP
jgi:hypothetical protein